MPLDINCDLGEAEPVSRTRALFRWIGSANVACGGHAGDLLSMARCVEWAKRHDVRLGAHPGLSGNFGRASVPISGPELALLVAQQVSVLAAWAKRQRVQLHHIKLHGALYHATEANPALALAYLQTIQEWAPRCRVMALAGGRVCAMGEGLGLRVIHEGFLDRGYRADGTLVPRGEVGSLLTFEQVRARLRDLAAGQAPRSVDGIGLMVRPTSWCIHGDGPDALRIAKAARAIV
ncbi:MAG TPA: 5-oxoprolinase subunit PxpA [Candidatus Limnocylindria bacterium]|jgi:UPF0271 protein|nr:5-oxoprolinase subunit PxpA [Candidatus Limnocylindria bacterium]